MGRPGSAGGRCAVTETSDQPETDDVGTPSTLISKSGPAVAHWRRPGPRRDVVLVTPPAVDHVRVTTPSDSVAVVSVTTAVTPVPSRPYGGGAEASATVSGSTATAAAATETTRERTGRTSPGRAA